MVCSLMKLVWAYIANNKGHDQSTPLGAAWSRFILFALPIAFYQVYLKYKQQTYNQAVRQRLSIIITGPLP